MAVVSGQITEITWNHPTLGSGVFYPKGDETHTINTGGYRTVDDAKANDGGGNFINQKEMNNWSVETVVTNDTVTRKDQDNAAAIAASPDLAEFTFTHVSGTVYGGTGIIVGDVNADMGKGTMALKFQGAGSLKRI